MYLCTVKKASRYSRPQPGCHLPWARIMTSYINYSRLVTSWLGTGISKSFFYGVALNCKYVKKKSCTWRWRDEPSAAGNRIPFDAVSALECFTVRRRNQRHSHWMSSASIQRRHRDNRHSNSNPPNQNQKIFPSGLNVHEWKGQSHEVAILFEGLKNLISTHCMCANSFKDTRSLLFWFVCFKFGFLW